jgi:hypothetical protein
MKVRNLIAYVLVGFAGVGGVSAQSTSEITLSQATVTVGDTLQIQLTLDEPSPCNIQIFVRFGGVTDQFTAYGNIGKDQTKTTITAQIPLDIAAGEYRTQSGWTNPCPGYQNIRPFTVPATTVEVKGAPDPNQFATHADIVLSVTQKQFLETKITEISGIESQLTTALEKDSAPTNLLRDQLLKSLDSAEKALAATERQYGTIMKTGEKPPPLFADFRLQYGELLVELNALQPEYPKLTELRSQHSPSLVYVQLKGRANGQQTEKPPNFSGTLSAIATAVWRTIRDNASAYKYIRNTGRITFDAALTSFPSGARIRYKKVADLVYEDYSSLTPVENASFELATWIFKFHKDGCADEPSLRIDPYEDTAPDISVEFTNCKVR